jgi:hypothetical protein
VDTGDLVHDLGAYAVGKCSGWGQALVHRHGYFSSVVLLLAPQAAM